MQLKRKIDGRIFEVYRIRDDDKGYPHALIYEDRQWKYVSMKHFTPISASDIYESPFRWI